MVRGVASRQNELMNGALVALLLAAVYLLTYRGLLGSIDELALYGATENLAQLGTLKVTQAEFARYHNPVGTLEPLHSVLAVPLYWLAVRLPWMGNIQTVLLLNIGITALTAGGLYLLLRTVNHSPAVATVSSMAYGLLTIAWPYTRTFLREPTTALLLLIAAGGLIRWQRAHGPGWLVLTLGGLTLATLTKSTSALAWPAFALVYLLQPDITQRRRLQRLALLAASALVGGAVLAWAYAQRGWGSLAVLLTLWRGPGLAETALRIFGLTLGAGRGLFVFTPLLLLILPGLALMWRRKRGEAWLALSLLVFYLLGYSRHGQWHAGLSWGSRFLVPVVPILMLAIAEWLAFVSQSRRWQAVIPTAVLMGASGAIQLAAATANASWVSGLSAWDNLFDYARSPALLILTHWRPGHFDMLWWHGPAPVHLETVYQNPWLALFPTLAMVAAARGLLVAHKGRTRASRQMGGVAIALLIAGIAVLLWQAPTTTHGYPGANPAELRQVAAIVNRDDGAPHTVVIVSNEFQLNVLLNYLKGRVRVYWLSPMQTTDFEPLLDQPGPPARSVHLIVDRVHILPEASGRDAELWLNARLHRYMVDWIGPGYEVYSYLPPLDDIPMQAADYHWTQGMAMPAFGLSPRTVGPGEPVWLQLQFTAEHKIAERYEIFTQLLAPDGAYMNGTDGAPQFGAAMTTWWQPGEIVVDRRAFFVPADAAPGEYQVVAGFYFGNERLPVLGAQGKPLGTHIDLGTVIVR